MKKFIVSSVAVLGVLASANVFAQVAGTAWCTGAAAGNSAAQVTPSATTFMKTTVNIKCSQNVFLQGADAGNGAAYAVAAASAKGKSIFGGHTNGGAVAPLTTACATKGGCLTGEVTTGLGEVVAAAQLAS